MTKQYTKIDSKLSNVSLSVSLIFWPINFLMRLSQVTHRTLLNNQMAFVMSKAQQPFSEPEADQKVALNDRDESRLQAPSPITSQLFLKPSSKALNKEVVLRRIRHHKRLNKVRSAFQGFLSTSHEEPPQHKWLDQNDNFSSP